MNTLFKKENIKATLSTILNLIVGVLFCVLHVKMYNFVESILCVFLLGSGIVCVSIYALMSREDKVVKLFLYGIVAVACGIFMLIWPRFFGIILSLIAGLGGFLMLIESISDKKKCIKPWVTDFVIGLIVTLISITAIILSGTNVAKIILSIFFGVIFLIQGVYNLILLLIIVKQEKNKAKPVEKENKIHSEEV